MLMVRLVESDHLYQRPVRAKHSGASAVILVDPIARQPEDYPKPVSGPVRRPDPILKRCDPFGDCQISGPAFVASERYDLLAKVPAGATKEQFQTMLQNLLAELDREQREQSTLGLAQ